MNGSFVPLVKDRNVEQYLIHEEGEQLVRPVVKHHWAVYVRPTLEMLLGFLLIVWATAFDPPGAWWLWFWGGVALLAHGGYLWVWQYTDLFVITNVRVFRVTGVLPHEHKKAAMQLSRILDITVRKPLMGRLLGYGHFVFESAAQEQGLREIRCVENPDGLDRTIQRMVIRSGKTPPSVPTDFFGEGPGTRAGTSHIGALLAGLADWAGSAWSRLVGRLR